MIALLTLHPDSLDAWILWPHCAEQLAEPQACLLHLQHHCTVWNSLPQPYPCPTWPRCWQANSKLILKSSVDAISLGKTPLSESDVTPPGILGDCIFLMVALNTLSYKLPLYLSGSSTGLRAQKDRGSPDSPLASRVPGAEAISEDWVEWRTVERTREKWNTPGRAGTFTGKEEGRAWWMPSCCISSLLYVCRISCSPWLTSPLLVPRAPFSYIPNIGNGLVHKYVLFFRYLMDILSTFLLLKTWTRFPKTSFLSLMSVAQCGE